MQKTLQPGASNKFAQGILLLLLHLSPLLTPVALAQTPRSCAICELPITKNAFIFNDVAHNDRKIVCPDCTTLTNRCHSCSIPVKTRFRSLDDGRVLCLPDSQQAVFDPAEALRLFDDTRRALYRMFAGYEPVPYNNLTLHLVAKLPPANTNRALPSEHEKWIALGQCRSSTSSPDRSTIKHDIYLIEGMSPARFASVAAHEFAHAWLNENLPTTRTIHPDTIEAFCELVAHKLMTDRNHTFEKTAIERNLYTRGQIHTLLKAESELRFHRLLDWMKTGLDDRILADDITGTVRLAPREIPPPVYYQPYEPPPPTKLALKAITGPPSNRLALLNSTPLAVNERAKVRLGQSNIVVRCLEIRARSILIQIEGETAPQEILLGP